MNRLLAAFASIAILVAGAACTGDGVGANEVSVVVDRGSRVLVGERGEGLVTAKGRRTLHVGAQVKVLAGSASVSLHDGTLLEVRKGSEIVVGNPVVLVAEDVLVTSAAKPVRVAAAGSHFTVAGVAQLSRDLAVSAATYRGSVTLRSAGRTLTIPALREAEAASLGVLPAEPDALDYDPADPWDRRFLGAAIDLGEELEAKSEGFTRSLAPGEGRTPGFYRILLPDLEKEAAFGEQLLGRNRRPGDLLIGATIAVNGRQGSFADRWASVFDFRDKGAKWGLVALDQQVNDIQGVVSSVDAAIGRTSFAFAPLPLPAVPVPVPATVPTTPATTPARAPAPTSPAPSSPTPAQAPRTPVALPPPAPSLLPVPELLPPTEPPTTPTEGILTPLLDTVTTTLDGLLGGK